MEAGYLVTVEESCNRCISDEDYRQVGCDIVPSGKILFILYIYIYI